MNRIRLAPLLLRAWLVLSLMVAPLVPAASVQAGGTGTVTVVAGMNMDHNQHAAACDPADRSQLPDGDHQHDNCNGPCCASCAHCTVTSAISPASSPLYRATLTAREPQLLSFAYISLRERPPRLTSV